MKQKFVFEVLVDEEFSQFGKLSEELEASVNKFQGCETAGGEVLKTNPQEEKKDKTIWDLQRVLLNKTYEQIEKETILSDETRKMISSCCEVYSTT